MATAIPENAAQIPVSPIKNLCEWFEPPMGAVTAFTQLRTDTTLDLSQKAEKVCSIPSPNPLIARPQPHLWVPALLLLYNRRPILAQKGVSFLAFTFHHAGKRLPLASLSKICCRWPWLSLWTWTWEAWGGRSMRRAGLLEIIEFKIKVIQQFNSNLNCFNFNKLNYKMQRAIESCSAHAEMLQKFQTVFPNLAIPQVSPCNSIFDALNQMIRKIPRPLQHETQQTISSMKSFVDGQQLRIQINMIEIQEAEPVPLQAFVKKCSIETRDDEDWDGRSIGNVEDWGWDRKGLYHQSLEHQFSSYLD